jgi:GGDEF domain-containing protein
MSGESVLLVEDSASQRAAILHRLEELGNRGRSTLPTLSAGVAAFPDDGLSKEELGARADLALYAAKNAGRNAVAGADGPRAA